MNIRHMQKTAELRTKRKKKTLTVLFTYKNAAEATFPVPEKTSCELVWGQPRMPRNRG